MISADNYKNQSYDKLRDKSRRSLTWFRDKLTAVGQKHTVTSRKAHPLVKADLMADALRQEQDHVIGNMYFFAYDPKHKKTLPYYDTFPLVFPIEIYPDGFLGLNFHYLDYRSRIILLSELSKLANNKKYDQTTRLKLSYQKIKAFSTMFQPTVKRYLSAHVKSPFIRVFANEWEHAVFLPLQNFEKASTAKVWKDSRAKM